MRVVITHVSDVADDKIAVGAWEADTNRLVSLLPAPGALFAAHDEVFDVGHALEFNPMSGGTGRGKPHGADEVVVNGGWPMLLGAMGGHELREGLSAHVKASVSVAFNGQVEATRTITFVPVGSPCASVAMLELSPLALVFGENEAGLTLTFADSSGYSYTLPVTCRSIAHIFRSVGADGVKRWFETFQREEVVNLQLVLAAPDERGACRLEVAGVILTGWPAD